MSPTPEHVAWIACAVIGYILVHMSLLVVEARARLATTRHDLVVEARKIRAEYHASITVSDEHAEIVEDDEDEADTGEDAAEPIPLPASTDAAAADADADPAELKPAA